MTDGRLDQASFIFHEFDGEVGRVTCIRLFWKRNSGDPSPLDFMPVNIAIAHRRAAAKGYTLSSQPTLVELQDVILEPNMGVFIPKNGDTGNYFMLTMQFEVLGRPNG